MDQDKARELNQDVAERMKIEMGNLLQQIIILQVQNTHLQREVDRLTALVPTTAGDNHTAISRPS
jgi:hypothetical protein